MQRYANIIYFKELIEIGGIESWFWYLAQKYCDYDITIVYDKANQKQLERLSTKVRAIKNNGQEFECDKAFFNFNTDIINKVNAKEYNLIIHGDYKDMIERKQIDKPPYHEKINNVIAVSKIAQQSYYELTGIMPTLCYNPIIKPKSDVLKLISATRLSKEKGFERIRQLAKRLDERKIKYEWYIYTNSPKEYISPNVVYLRPRLDIADFMKGYSYFIQLSDNEGYCYSVVEALLSNVPCVITPCQVFEEIGLDKSNSITLDFDCKNIDDVIDKMITKKFNFDYIPKEDNWLNIIEKEKSTYKEEMEMRYEVKATKMFESVRDSEAGRYRKEGETWEVDAIRYNQLINYKDHIIELVKKIEPKEENTKNDELVKESKKVAKKPSKTAKKR